MSIELFPFDTTRCSLKLPAPHTPCPLSQRRLDAKRLAILQHQLEILVLLAQGKSAKEIAFELGLSSKTVDVHRNRIMERLGLKDLASLTRYAVRKGLVKP